jgi:peptidoglycan/LPS O-acetylase OafA/YrhL
MGTLRLILALLVALGHMRIAGGLFGVGHVIAVKAFYVISGFYMSLILNDKYRHRSVWAFYGSRALRLFPLYWVILILSVVFALYLSPRRYHLSNFIDLEIWKHLLANPRSNYPALLWLGITNVFIVGLHWAQSFCVNIDSGVFARTGIDLSSPPGSLPLISFSPIQPAWTLSIELIFYSIAPFIVRRRLRAVLIFLATGIALRYLMGAIGLDHNPWNRTLVAFEFVYFVMGMVAYRIYRVLLPFQKQLFRFGWIAWLAFIGLTCLWSDLLPASFNIHQPGRYGVLYYTLLMLFIPIIFLWSKDRRFDNFLGELSYPAYIVHLFILCSIDEFGGQRLFAAMGSNAFAWDSLHIIVILIISYLLARIIVEPIDRFRTTFIKRFQVVG